MTVIKKITVKNFRVHEDITTTLSPNTTVITGKNGSGKTSIIEAIYLGLQGRSFKGVDKDILSQGKDWWRIDIEFSDGTKRQIKYDNQKITSKKQFIIDNKINYRLPNRLKIPVVLFEPTDLRLLNGSPNRRRDFIDDFICQITPEYSGVLGKYERALKQRNNLLKNKTQNREGLFVWDVALSEYGSQIIEQRILFIEKLNTQISDLYNNISGNEDAISVHYSHTYIGDIKQKLINDLSKNRDKDTILGYTTTGPHRHDVIFNFNNSPALSVASRGEVRTIVIALKFIEVNLIEEITGQNPIILLDDVFSELDITRQESLITDKKHQIIITSTDDKTVKNFGKSKLSVVVKI